MGAFFLFDNTSWIHEDVKTEVNTQGIRLNEGNLRPNKMDVNFRLALC